MSQKRQQNYGGMKDKGTTSEGNSPEDKRRRVPSLRNVVHEVMRRENFRRLESMIRKVVKEEVDLALRNHGKSYKWTVGKDALPSESRSLRLKFISTLSLPVFTGTRIEAEDGSPIKVALTDAITGEVVQFDPICSSKVEIVVLEGDFEKDERENWKKEEFDNYIAKEREGKKPLLIGDLNLTLKEGMGVVGDLSFTDNSSWTRSRRFRLGARLVGNTDGLRVREAITESFTVRDHRGELYKKHYPPTLVDEVWRLEKIGKDGAFHKRLSTENIKTVRDFLVVLNLDPARLRHIMGSGMSTKMWEVTIEHAQTCEVGKRVYLFHSPGSQPRKGVVFNVVGEVIGLFTNHVYTRANMLSESEMHEAQKLVNSAFLKWEGVTLYEDENSLLSSSSVSPTTIPITDSSRSESPYGSKHLPPQDINRFDNAQPPEASSSDVISSLSPTGFVTDNYWWQTMDFLDRNEPPPGFLGQVSSSPWDDDTDSLLQNIYDDDQLVFFNSGCSLQSQNTGSGYQPDLISGSLQPPSTARTMKGAQRRWRLVLNVLQWFFLLRGIMRRSRSGGMQKYY